jgi:DNA invertase Pin-like site-specific DNA recombinase
LTNVGYLRVSTLDQHLELQRDALVAAGCERFFEDRTSGSKESRPGLDACMEFLSEGDVLVVWRLDRLGRSLKHLLQLTEELRDRGVDLMVTTMGVDTRTPTGKMIFQIFAVFAEFERNLIIERTHAGLAAARARGRVGGRRRVLSPDAAKVARSMYAERGEDGKRAHTVQKIADVLGCSRGTIYGYLDADSKVAGGYRPRGAVEGAA